MCSLDLSETFAFSLLCLRENQDLLNDFLCQKLSCRKLEQAINMFLLIVS